MSQAALLNESRGSDRGMPLSSILLCTVMLVVGGAFLLAEHRLQGQQVSVVEDVASGPGYLRQLGLIAIGVLGGLLLILPNRRSLDFTSPLAILVIALGLLCVVSLLWTPAFSLSLRRLSGVVLCGTGGLGICMHFSLRDLCKIVFVISGTFLCIGILFEVLGHGFVMASSRYRFGGSVNPNLQALYCSMLGLTSMCLQRDAPRSGFLLRLIFVVAVGFLLLTGSRTALYSFVVAVTCYVWVLGTPIVKAVLVTGLTACLTLIVVLGELLMGGMATRIVGMITVGRNVDTISTLTGRGPLWSELLQDFGQRPLLGYGFQGYWTGDRILGIGDSTGWAAQGAHNSYLEVALGVGIVGCILFVLILGVGIFRARRLFISTEDPGYGFALLWLVFAVVHSLAEGVFAKPTLFPGMVFLCVLMMLAVQRHPMMVNRAYHSHLNDG